jgi:hypothetical protein
LILDRDSYVFGDEFTFTLRLEALYPTTVAVRGSIAEIEPSDPESDYEWRPMGISLELWSPNHYVVEVGLLQLYGSKDVPGSEIELKTGEWIELHGKARMEWTNSPPGPGSFPHREEKLVLPLPLKHPQEFRASALIGRGQGYWFDAQTRQETRVCHPAEQSLSSHTTVTVVPKRTR